MAKEGRKCKSNRGVAFLDEEDIKSDQMLHNNFCLPLLGLCEGVKQSVYFPGFPTFKHIGHSVSVVGFQFLRASFVLLNVLNISRTASDRAYPEMETRTLGL